MSASLSPSATTSVRSAAQPVRPLPSWSAPSEQPAESPRRRLEVVPGRSPRPRIIAALGAVGLMLGIGLLQLLLSIAIGDSAYQLSDLQARARDLDRVAAQLQQELAVLNSPQNLGNNAGPLELVPATSNAFMTLHNGRLHGTPEPAAAGPVSSGADTVANSQLEGIGVVTGSRTMHRQPTKPAPTKPDRHGRGQQQDHGPKQPASDAAGQQRAETDDGLIAAPETH